MKEFKLGDTVRCLPGFQSSGRGNPYNGGAGYEEGRIFKVTDITNDHTGRGDIYWPCKRGNGVYAIALELVPVDAIAITAEETKIKKEIYGT